MDFNQMPTDLSTVPVRITIAGPKGFLHAKHCGKTYYFLLKRNFRGKTYYQHLHFTDGETETKRIRKFVQGPTSWSTVHEIKGQALQDRWASQVAQQLRIRL